MQMTVNAIKCVIYVRFNSIFVIASITSWDMI